MDTDELYQTLATRFDKVAKVYDAAYGPATETGSGSALLDWLRQEHLAVLKQVFPEGASVLDIGCGTGEESIALYQLGYSIVGIDISPAMIRQAQTKAAVNNIRIGLKFETLPAGQLDMITERGPFQGAFSSLGTLNTEPDLAGVVRGLHDRLEPGAPFVATVMSRRSIYEIWHNFRAGASANKLQRDQDWAESRAGAGGVTAPVKFYTPSAFAAAFKPYFKVESVQAFPLFLPPIHMQELYSATGFERNRQWDQRLRSWPLLRGWGDHFLMILRRL
jgi:SAM-dependent methyltransferase